MFHFKEFEGNDYEDISSKDFEFIIASSLERFGKIEREVKVCNRGDGRTGRVDMVLSTQKEKIGIEIDRKSPRAKSFHKLKNLAVDRRLLIIRSPFTVIEIT